MSDGTTILLVLAGLVVLAMVVVAVILLVKMVKARKLLNEAGIPVQNKFLFWGAVAYLISPVDLLPDPVLLDDIGIMLIALRSLYAAAEKAGLGRHPDRHQDRHPDRHQNRHPDRRQDSRPERRPDGYADPYPDPYPRRPGEPKLIQGKVVK